MRRVLITGSNRGLGAGLVGHYLKKGDFVVAAARDPLNSKILVKLKEEYPENLQLETLDVKSEVSVKALAVKLEDGGAIDLLINNAGILREAEKSLEELNLDDVSETFEVNVIGAMRVTRRMLPLLKQSASPVVANMSSKMGSIADNTSGRAYGYRISKSALNMFNRSLTVDFPNIKTVILHPGWVKTDMGGPSAMISIDESIAGMGAVLENLNSSGKFINYKGEELPW